MFLRDEFAQMLPQQSAPVSCSAMPRRWLMMRSGSSNVSFRVWTFSFTAGGMTPRPALQHSRPCQCKSFQSPLQRKTCKGPVICGVFVSRKGWQSCSRSLGSKPSMPTVASMRLCKHYSTQKRSQS